MQTNTIFQMFFFQTRASQRLIGQSICKSGNKSTLIVQWLVRVGFEVALSIGQKTVSPKTTKTATKLTATDRHKVTDWQKGIIACS